MKKSFLFCAVALIGLFASAEPDNGRALPTFHAASPTNFYLEGNIGIAFPLSFLNKDLISMTSNGKEFALSVGYNWDGYLIGLEYGRTMWGQGTGEGALMNNFNNNLFLFKLQRVLSHNTFSFLPEWLELVPGTAIGVNAITTDYYPSERAKREGRENHVEFGNSNACCIFGRFSFESSIYLGTDMFIPFLGADYNVFYDKSIGGGSAQFFSAFAGIRTYPFGFVNDIKRRNAQKKAEQELAEEERRKARELEIASWAAAQAFIHADPNTNFTPDEDNINDIAYLYPSVERLEEAPESWKIEIFDPKDNLFKTFSGVGAFPEKIEWDGKSDSGEKVFSKNTYGVKLSVVPSAKDQNRTNQTLLEATDKITTGIQLQVIEPEKEWRIVVNTIFFDPDKPTFNEISEAQRQSNKETLDSVASQINAHPGCKVVIEGYANNVTNTEREDKEELVPLSQARAEAILEQLVDRGLIRKMLSAKGFGGAKPLAAWEDHANWWKNRRVEFLIKK